MKLIMTLLVRDEEDIVAANIDFHLAHGVDFFIATDNLSVDGTTEYIAHLRAAGCSSLYFEADDDHAQYRWVTTYGTVGLHQYGADWVINNDADEFWWPKRRRPEADA